MNIFEEVKLRASCRELAEESGAEFAGRSKAVCPLCHYEKSPTFHATDDYFKCHHCHKGGDAIRLVAENDKTDDFQAAMKLAARFGVEARISEPQRREAERRAKKADIFKEFAEHFSSNLPPAAAAYLADRGLTQETIKNKLIGFIPSEPDQLEISEETRPLFEAGLPGILRGRILLPFWQCGQIVYFTGRSLPGQDEGPDGRKYPKYLNQRGDKTYSGTVRGPELYITEGPLDQLMAEQTGLNCIAIAGSGKVPKMHQGVKRVILAFDGDEAGRKFIDKHAVEILEQGPEVYVLVFPEGEDMADHLLKNGGVTAPEVSLVHYYLDQLRAEPKNKELRAVVYRVMKYMDEVDRGEVFNTLKTLWKTTVQAVRKDFQNYTQEEAESEYSTEEGMKYKVPEGYYMTDKGISAGKMQVTYEPFFVSRIGSNRQTGVEYCEIKYNSNGSTRSRIVERRVISKAADLLEESNSGAPVNSANALQLVRFFDAWLARNKEILPSFEVTGQLGWMDAGITSQDVRFVLSDRIIDGTSQDLDLEEGKEKSMYYRGAVPEKAFKRKGTLDGWVKAIKPLGGLESGHVARFVLYAGFASIILEPLNLRPFVIHLHGDTSQGKTTALRVPASIYGNPVEGAAMIRWHNTQNFIVRYMESLKNVPLCIDELSSESRATFDSIIYMMESGISKGKALKDDPNGVAALRTFRLGVFSSGEPPILGGQSMGGAAIRVWEFSGSPFGESCPELVKSLEIGLQENHGVAVDTFLKNFSRLRESIFRDDTTFFAGEMEDLTNVERRALKTLNYIYLTGMVANACFDLGWNVADDMRKIFETIRLPISEKTRTVEHVLEDIQGLVAQNPLAFPEVVSDAFDPRQQRKVVKSADGKIPSKVMGYLFPNDQGGFDLGIIRSFFIEWASKQRNQTNAGFYLLNLLKDRGVISDPRAFRRISGQGVYVVLIPDFFKETAGPGSNPANQGGANDDCF